MPTYDYFCKTCDITKEILHSIHYTSPINCEKCGKPMVKQVSATSLLQFKGGGFYCNEYPKKEDNAKG